MGGDFPGNSVTKTWYFRCKGRGFKHSVSDQGTKIPYAAKCSHCFLGGHHLWAEPMGSPILCLPFCRSGHRSRVRLEYLLTTFLPPRPHIGSGHILRWKITTPVKEFLSYSSLWDLKITFSWYFSLRCPHPPRYLPNPGIELGLLPYRQILYNLSHQQSPILTKLTLNLQDIADSSSGIFPKHENAFLKVCISIALFRTA